MRLFDGLSNFLSGLGGANAKVSGTVYSINTLDPFVADQAFHSSTWYGKILRIPVDDATKKWRSWKATSEQIELLEAEEKRIGLRMKIHEALLIARHRGGAAIVVGGLKGASNTELTTVAKGDIKFLHVLDRDELQPVGVTNDPYSPYFRQPEYWTIKGRQIHPSRLMIFNGRKPPGMSMIGEFWGQGIWSHLSDAVMASDSGAAILSALMHEAKIDVIKIPGLTEELGNDVTTEQHIKRWTMVAQMKSIANVLMLDAGDGGDSPGEEWQQKQIHFQQLPEVQQMLLKIMSGAADIPVTRLLGEQQTGLSGSDSGSLRNYYDAVAAEQELRITPALDPLDKIVIQSALGALPKEIWYEWNPLWQMSETEKAEVDKLESETAVNYANSGLVPLPALETTIHNRMIETGRWPGLEKALADAPEDAPRLLAPPVPVLPNGQPAPPRGAVATDAAPRTLYVRRDVLNAAEIISWAKSQGFETTLPADDLHVTVVFSRNPVDWMKMGQPWEAKLEIPAGGPRLIEQFGEATVLLFASNELEWRHEKSTSIGASWDHAEYQPHITITYSGRPSGTIDPYKGKIVLGPEIFEEIKEDWQAGIVEK